jgi:hypothetical protein
LKGPCHKIFYLWFLHKTTSPRPLGSSVFEKWLRISEVIQKSRLDSGVIDSTVADTAVSMTDTAVADTVVSLTPLSPEQRCTRGSRIREALAPFKENIIKKTYIGKLYYPIAITLTHKIYLRITFGDSGVIDTAVAKVGDFKVEYLRDF